jgi:hypothetical protein
MKSVPTTTAGQTGDAADLRLDVAALAVATGSSAAGYNATLLCLATAALPDCSTLTLASGADVDNWVWADATRPGVAYQSKMGSRAVTQVMNLPF